MWVGMLVVDVRIVFVAMNHGRVAMPVRMLGRSRRAICMNVPVVYVMVMLMAVLQRLVRVPVPVALR
jgi:hypothetical protein